MLVLVDITICPHQCICEVHQVFGIFYWIQGWWWWTWQQVKDLVVQVVMDVSYLVGSSSMLMLSLTLGTIPELHQ